VASNRRHHTLCSGERSREEVVELTCGVVLLPWVRTRDARVADVHERKRVRVFEPPCDPRGFVDVRDPALGQLEAQFTGERSEQQGPFARRLLTEGVESKEMTSDRRLVDVAHIPREKPTRRQRRTYEPRSVTAERRVVDDRLQRRRSVRVTCEHTGLAESQGELATIGVFE